MKIVKLIDDVWDKPDAPKWIKNVLLVDDLLPVKNQEYVVSSIYMMPDEKGTYAYRLEGFEHLLDYEENAGWFKVERFEVVSDEHIPNSLIKIRDAEFLAEKISIVTSINFRLDVPAKNIKLTTFIKE